MSVPEGTRVHVEFDGVVKGPVDYSHYATQLVESDSSGSNHHVFITFAGTSGDVTIVGEPKPERPKYWPPQNGDVWTLDDHPGVTAYYVYTDDDTRELMFMADGLGYCTYPVKDDAGFVDMKWRLLFRNGQAIDNR